MHSGLGPGIGQRTPPQARALAQPQLLPGLSQEQAEPGEVRYVWSAEVAPAGICPNSTHLSLHAGPLPAFGHVLVCELAFL